MMIWDGFIWGGMVLIVVGLVVLVWCMVMVVCVKFCKLDDEGMCVVMCWVVVVNMVVLVGLVFGLMFVVFGIMLGC